MPRYTFLVGFPITISKLEILNCIYVESMRTINKLCSLYFRLPCYNGKITRKEMSKLFSCHCERYGEISPRSTGKKMIDFDYREEYLKGVYQIKYYYGSVKKTTFSFSSDLQIDKKINNVIEAPRRKTDSNFDFSQVLRCLSSYEVSIRRNIT